MKRQIPLSTRQIVSARDSGTCREPGCSASKEAGDTLHLHHIKPEQFGGTEDPDNLVTLCDIHHKMMHTEFHAFYPDSRNVLLKMLKNYNAQRSKLYRKLGVDDGYDLTPYLKYLTGVSSFREGQIKAIRAAINKRDVLFVTPTGSGKSVCYQLPGFYDNKPALVLSPLKALMKDQVESIWRRKIPATYINSDLSYAEKAQRFNFIKQGLYKFLFVAPERFFKSKDMANEALYQDYSYLVVDEAHEIDLWGKSFRSSYSKIGDLREKIGRPPVIALTASASEETQKVIVSSLDMHDPEIIVTGFYRNNITILKHHASKTSKDRFNLNKLNYVKNVLAESVGQKTLIFVPTKKSGKELLGSLTAAGFEVEFYHGELDHKTKMNIQNKFTGRADPKLDVLISTSAFGMGIDIPDIRNVIHWTPALSIEDYYQQIGRAGRDGLHSYAHLLYHDSDKDLLKYIATIAIGGHAFKTDHNYTDEDVARVRSDVEHRLEKMIDLMQVPATLEWQHILDYFGQKSPTFWDKHGKRILDTLNVLWWVVFVTSLLFLAIGVFGFVFEYAIKNVY